jgi:hypothetical protein
MGFVVAQEPEQLGLAAAPSSILGDHLQLNLPKGARIQARGHGIMAAGEPDSDETRAVLDLGDSRLVLMAEESYAMVPEDFLAGIKAAARDDAVAAANLEPVPMPEPLIAFASAKRGGGVDGTGWGNLSCCSRPRRCRR